MGPILEGVVIALVPIFLVQSGTLLYWAGQISRTVREHDEFNAEVRKKLWG